MGFRNEEYWWGLELTPAFANVTNRLLDGSPPVFSQPLFPVELILFRPPVVVTVKAATSVLKDTKEGSETSTAADDDRQSLV